ncbi:MAG: DHA2 family efflux MFS transporter permease subunit [Bacillota bacterium]|nr:DHA2 family efflux MFS transporter permease subunit [Bacillota bacterium]
MTKSKKILAFVSLAIACFLTVLDGTIVNVSLPNMAKYFSTDITGISWVTTAYLIPFSALLINFSKVADIYGRKKLFLIGLAVFGISSICCGLSTSLIMIIGFRILQGIGAAILTPLAIPLGIELFGKAAMGKLAIIVGMIISIAAASGPVIGGALNEAFGFKAIFYVNIPFIIIALIFGFKYVKECYDRTINKKLDIWGSILLAFGLGAITFSLVKGNDYGWGSTAIVALIISAVISLIAFVTYEYNNKSPMIDIKLFKIGSYTSSIVLISVIFFAYMPISYLMNFYLENGLGYSVMKAGLILGLVSAVAFVMSPIFGLISKKTSARVVSLFAVIFVSLGNLEFVFMNSTNNMKVIYSAFILLGLGLGATTPLYQSAFEEISEDKNGIASGLLNSMRQLTACIAIALVATLSSQFTTVAVHNTQDKMISNVNQSIVLQQEVKNKINGMIKTANTSDNLTFSKKTIHDMVLKEESTALANVPLDMQSGVKQKFNVQEQEMYKIADKANTIKHDETNKVYNKCFLITGILALLGLFAVPFNKKRKYAEACLESGS